MSIIRRVTFCFYLIGRRYAAHIVNTDVHEAYQYQSLSCLQIWFQISKLYRNLKLEGLRSSSQALVSPLNGLQVAFFFSRHVTGCRKRMVFWMDPSSSILTIGCNGPICAYRLLSLSLSLSLSLCSQDAVPCSDSGRSSGSNNFPPFLLRLVSGRHRCHRSSAPTLVHRIWCSFAVLSWKHQWVYENYILHM